MFLNNLHLYSLNLFHDNTITLSHNFSISFDDDDICPEIFALKIFFRKLENSLDAILNKNMRTWIGNDKKKN